MAEAYICRSGYQRYCVGDIFITTRAGNPSVLLGYGTWQQIKDKFLLAAGDSYAAESTGGESEHTLTEDEMPAHQHNFKGTGIFSAWNYPHIIGPGKAYPSYPSVSEGSGYSGDGYVEISKTGGSQPHNNMPPYLAVNMWIRVA